MIDLNLTSRINNRDLYEASPVDNICLTNHTGAFCYQCVPGTVKRTGKRICQACEDSDYEKDRIRIASIFAAIGIVLFLLLALTYVYTYRSYLFTLGKATKRGFEDRALAIYRSLGEYSDVFQVSRQRV